MRFEMSGEERLNNALARLAEEGFAEVYEGTRRGSRPLLLVPIQRREDAVRALRIVLDADPEAQTLV